MDEIRAIAAIRDSADKFTQGGTLPPFNFVTSLTRHLLAGAALVLLRRSALHHKVYSKASSQTTPTPRLGGRSFCAALISASSKQEVAEVCQVNTLNDHQNVTSCCPNFRIAADLHQIDLILAGYTVNLDQIACRRIEISDRVGSCVGFEDEHVGTAAAGHATTHTIGTIEGVDSLSSSVGLKSRIDFLADFLPSPNTSCSSKLTFFFTYFLGAWASVWSSPGFADEYGLGAPHPPATLSCRPFDNQLWRFSDFSFSASERTSTIDSASAC
ncbi:hypothetical protein [uncultured Roseobacter sp.]|uniref:hypothetical protein n=1 Tax=uncultured Roseobacter sp. TaxID=114847 RepID=UPI00262BC175|nr:hypothetical protein [uncultured Roseobacter sp.]